MLSTAAFAGTMQITSPLPLPVICVSGCGGSVSPTGPTVSLSSIPSGQAEELGTVFSSTLTATTVKGSLNITGFDLKRNGSVVFTDATPATGGGSETYIDPAISATSAYLAEVTDGTNTGTSNTVTFTFVYPFYYGVGAQALTFAQVQGLTKLVQTQQNTTTTTSPNSQVYYFAYPQAYGVLTSILDQNGFETIGGYTRRTGTMTMLDSTTQNYYVYEFNNPTIQTNFRNTYKF